MSDEALLEIPHVYSAEESIGAVWLKFVLEMNFGQSSKKKIIISCYGRCAKKFYMVCLRTQTMTGIS